MKQSRPDRCLSYRALPALIEMVNCLAVTYMCRLSDLRLLKDVICITFKLSCFGGLNGVNRLATNGEKCYWLPAKWVKNYLLLILLVESGIQVQVISWNYYFYYSNTFHFLVITWADKNLPRKFSWILLAISPREKQSHAKFWLPVGNSHLPWVINRAYFKYVNGGLIRFYPVLNLFIMSVCISIVLLVL